MIYEETAVAGAFVLKPERRADDRGFFVRTHCEAELAQRQLDGHIAQINTGFNPRAGTLRGMHFQTAPHAEVKIVRCVRGAAFDVVLDLRPASPSFKRWFGVELSADNGVQLYLPEGTAHGYLTLADNTELMYTTSRAYAPANVGGVRHDDPAFGIAWPAPITLVSQADRNWPVFAGA